MFIQIEITTVCNAKCFYCPTDTLKHIHMSQECYLQILNTLKEPTTLLLQGMGEPLLHPFFWDMVALAKQHGHRISVITNGTIHSEPSRLHLLSHIGFSLDTLDEEVARKSGRPSPQKVIKHLLECYEQVPKKIAIYGVYYNQDIAPLKTFAKKHSIPLRIQMIQTKKSYQVNYEMDPLEYQTFRCSYLENEKMCYYFVDGTKAPCCYMIDVSNVLPKDEIKMHLAQKRVPLCCTQCGELTGQKRLYM